MTENQNDLVGLAQDALQNGFSPDGELIVSLMRYRYGLQLPGAVELLKELDARYNNSVLEG